MAPKDQTPAPKGLPDAHDGGVAQKQAIADQEAKQGYRGVVPDPTPNHNYTVAGNDLPTPETDRTMHRALVERTTKIEENFADVVPQEPNPADGDDAPEADEAPSNSD